MNSSTSVPWESVQRTADVQGQIAQLWVYPVKSCAGVAVTSARLETTGLAHDREWMVVDPLGVFLTQRSHPRMALIAPQLRDDGAVLALSAPGMPALVVQPPVHPLVRQVQVWDDAVAAHDQGDDVGQWLSTFLQTECRLVRFDRSQQRDCSRKWTGSEAASTMFADGYPLLITTAAAGDELRDRVHAAGGPAVGLERFRANVVLSGLAAHEEDYLEQLHADTAGAVVTLRPVKPCTRCPIPDIDPVTALRSTHVSSALADYRADSRMGGAITFGMNAIVTSGAGRVLQVGQSVAGVLAFA